MSSFDLAYKVANAVNYLSIASCSISLLAFAYRKYQTGTRDTIQVKLGMYLIATGLLYSAFQTFDNNYSGDDFWCRLGVWGWLYFQNLSVFYTAAIAHNIQETILKGKLRQQQRWENIYFFTPMVFAMILAIIPWIAGVYGFVEDYNACWIMGTITEIPTWLFCISYFWIIIGCGYSLVIVFLVILKITIKKENNESTRSSISKPAAPQLKLPEASVPVTRNIIGTSPIDFSEGKSITRKSSRKRKGEKKISRRIFNILAPYSIILFFCQASSLVDMFYPADARSIPWNVYDLSSSAIQGFLYTILVLRNPNILSFDSSAADTLDIILGNNELTNVLMSFLKTLLCEENLEFYLAAQDFKYAYLADELINTFTESTRLKQELYEKYFKETGALNIPYDLQKAMKKILTSKEMNYTMFDEVMKHVKGMISSDSMPKFMKSEYYKEIEEKIRFEKIKRKL